MARPSAATLAREDDDTKVCSTCDRLLPLDRFSPDARGRRGLTARCHDCRNAYAADYYARRRAMLERGELR